MSRQEDFIDAGIAYCMEHSKPMCIAGSNLADVERDFNRVISFEAGCEHGYQYALTHPQWIPVEERLPKVGEPVWFYTPSMDEPLKGAYQENGTWYSVEYECKFINGVTHWMDIVPPRNEE